MRALSVTLVLLFHVSWPGGAGGFIGVDVFFVISGYLMTRIVVGALDRGTFSYGRFLIARAARIWPALAVLVLVLLALGTAALPPADLLRLARQSIYALLFCSNQHFHDSAGYATGGADTHWLLHTWTLSLEWQFYLLYPLVLVAAARWATRHGTASGRRRALVLMTMLLGLSALSLGVYLFASASDPNSAFFLLWARAWELLAGGVVAISPRSTSLRPRTQAIASYAGVASIVAAALLIGWRHLPPVGLGAYSLLPVAGAALVLWADFPDNVILKPRPVQAIGLWSYSIYLWHWPIVAACAMGNLLGRYPHPGKELVMVASVLSGFLSYRHAEPLAQPGRPAGRDAGGVRPLVPSLLAAAAAAFVLVTGGLSFRDPHGPGDWRRSAEAEPPTGFPDRCGNFQKPARELVVCSVERGPGSRVLVIGDSHAAHLYPWFDEHSLVSVDFLTSSGCPPVTNMERRQPGFHCADFAKVAWSRASRPEYRTVIVSAKWNLAGGSGPPYCHSQATGSCIDISGEPKRDAIRSELRVAIRSLLGNGKQIVVVDGSPASEFDVPKRLDRELFWFGKVKARIDRESVAADYGWIDPMFDEFLASPSFHRVSLLPSLCDASSCKVYDEALRRPVYSDHDHFDPVWIAARGDVLAQFARPAQDGVSR